MIEAPCKFAVLSYNNISVLLVFFNEYTQRIVLRTSYSIQDNLKRSARVSLCSLVAFVYDNSHMCSRSTILLEVLIASMFRFHRQEEGMPSTTPTCTTSEIAPTSHFVSFPLSPSKISGVGTPLFLYPSLEPRQCH